METIVIQTQSKSTTKLLVELAKKLGEKVSVLSKDQVEDLALGEMMNTMKTGRTVSKDSIMDELNS